MRGVHYINGEAYFDAVPLSKIAEKYGTPCYVYSRAILEKNYLEYETALKSAKTKTSPLICYAVKANSNLAILNLLAHLGSGFDIVSGGELERVLAADGDPQKIIFSGVGKQTAEIKAALEANIYCFNVESESELENIQTIAATLNKPARIALRVNPDIDAFTHPYIATGMKDNKFGIELKSIKALRQKIKKMSHIQLIGLACHIGSQLTQLEPFIEVLRCLEKLYREFSADNFTLKLINVGGGLGVRYRNEHPPSRQEYVSMLQNIFSTYPVKLVLEPGRSIVADAGILLTRIEYLKETQEKNFAITDAGMNDLMRPALYHAWHDIIPLRQRSGEAKTYDIAGPLCESADFLGRDRHLRLAVGDYLGILMAGAYGFSMSSHYNSRPRPPEILIDGKKNQLIRRREKIKELFALEKIPDKVILDPS